MISFHPFFQLFFSWLIFFAFQHCRKIGYVSYETRLLNQHEKYSWIRFKLKLLNDRTLIGVAKNITREKTIETKLSIENEKLEDLITYRTFELQKTKNQYHSLINGATDIIFSINREFKINVLNDAGCLLIGLPLSEIINQPVESVSIDNLGVDASIWHGNLV